MGLFSKIFGSGKRSAVASAATSISFLEAYNGRKTGGWGLDRFNSVVEAHSSVEDIVEEFEIDGEDSRYMSPDGYRNCWTQAYQEQREQAEFEAEILAMLGEDVSADELIDWDIVEENAYEYACELVQNWLDGSEWIPEEIMEYAWYDLSDHNI